ncbi:MAG: glycoside hydrolase family 11 protein [Firmicutes bacterium]|nr:glycoside hydrolase family 11 protein [Bacillota bacterium]
MSRKYKTIRNISIIFAVAVVCFLINLWSGEFLSKDALFRHWEKENHYGAAEKILLDYETPDGKKGLVIGKYDGGIGVMSCVNRGFGWELNGYPNAFIDCSSERRRNGEGQFTTHINGAYGWTPVEETEEVFFYMAERWIDDKPLTDVAKVDDDGFFYKIYDEERSVYTGSGSTTYIHYLEGRDKDRNVIWTSGRQPDGLETEKMFVTE